MIHTGMALSENVKVVTGLAPITPSTSVPDYVSLKGYTNCLVVIIVDNGATVTGSAITLKQAQAVANTGEKELAFATVKQNVDTGAADTLTAADVSSNTFTTNTTDNKNLIYLIDVKETDLDINNGFDCLRAGTGNAANTVLSVIYVLHGAKYSKSPTPAPSAILD